MIRRLIFFLSLAALLCSCTTYPTIAPQVNSLVVAEKYRTALKILDTHKEGYGKTNELLYFLDRGLVLHMARRYEESIQAFESAKRKYDQLYTRSLSNLGATWIVNDYRAPYRGEDFERVMINVFQALNFAALDNPEEALVEARDVDRILRSINDRYDKKKNIYKEDAFARLLMGILYEWEGAPADLNDAYISYAKAVEIYEKDYLPNYDVKLPAILKENILAAAQWMGDEEFRKYRQKFGGVTFLPLNDKKKKAEVYVIHYTGLSPIKHEDSLVFPLPDGYLSRVAFPTYDERIYEEPASVFSARSSAGQTYLIPAELSEDIGGLAIKSLSDRRGRLLAKAFLRPLGKYAAEQAAASTIDRNTDSRTGGDVVRILGSAYNIYSEQADLRSWQTLPDQIRIARLILSPGEYTFYMNKKDLGTFTLKSGQKKFLIVRTNR